MSNQSNKNKKQAYLEKIQDCRKKLISYYKQEKHSLKMVHIHTHAFLGNIKKTQNQTFYENIVYETKGISEQELFNKYGKYNTSYDNSGNIIFFTDNCLYKDKINVEINNFQKSITGFPNIGNSCYMNSFLQILLHTPKFLNYLYEYIYKGLDKDSLIYNILNLSKYPLNSNYLLQIKKIMGGIDPKYATFIPGDSQSFAIDFLDQLISECKNEESNGDSFESTYDKTLSKKESYRKFCDNNHNKKDKIERLFQFTEFEKKASSLHNYNFSINLNIELCFPPKCNDSIDLLSLLNNKYSNNNNYYDTKPKLSDLPEILIISFVRGIEGKDLIKTKVRFKEILDLGPYSDLELTKNLKCKSYILYGINERYGQYKTQGHYVCFIKIDNKIWFRFSDIYVTKYLPDFNSPDVFGLYYVRMDCV